MKKQFIYFCNVFLLLYLFINPSFAQNAKEAVVLNISGTITPATQDFITRSIQEAGTENAALVILRLDTLGGIEKSIRDLDKTILASPIPVIAYVTPTGAQVGGAGIFILYASHIAAMAPNTSIGTTPAMSEPKNKQSAATLPPDATEKNKIHEQNLPAHERNLMNTRITYLRNLADLHNRNADWAEQALRTSASLSADAALKEHVINFIAKDTSELLQKVNDTSVKLNGSTVTLTTSDLSIKEMNPDWRYQFLNIITNPNIAYLLLLIGIYGLFFEFYNPGFILPGGVGAIALLLSLYSFQLLPINFVGFALLLLGITFMIIEVLISSFGILGVAGVIAFFTGSILLLDINSPGYQIAWSLIIAMTAFTVIFFLILIRMAIYAMRAKVLNGSEALIGTTGEIIEFHASEGLMKLNGELWKVKSQTSLATGQKARVLNITGLVLTVEAVNDINEK